MISGARARGAAFGAALACCSLAGVSVTWTTEACAKEEELALFIGPLPEVDVEMLEKALAAELGVSVKLVDVEPTKGLVIRAGPPGQIVVMYRGEGRTIERTIDLPRTQPEAVEAIALLAGNLVRDEASEILEELARSRKPRLKEPEPLPPPAPPIAKPRASVAVPPRSRCARAGMTEVPFAVDFVPYAGSSSVYRGRDTSTVGLGVLGTLSGGVRGLQLGTFVSVAPQFLCGAQISGVVNVAGEGDGAQVGLVNVERGDLRGAQVGLVNVADGGVDAQIGLVNVAKASKFSLGLVSVVRDGRTHLDVWGTSWGMIGVGVKHGGDYFHNLYGMEIRASEEPRWSPVVGFGVHFPLMERLYLDVDILAHAVFRFDNIDETATVAELRVPLGVVVVPKFAIFVGGSYNFGYASRIRDANLGTFGVSLLRYGDGLAIASWPGIVLGIQAF